MGKLREEHSNYFIPVGGHVGTPQGVGAFQVGPDFSL